MQVRHVSNDDLKIRKYDGMLAYSRDKRRQVALVERFAELWGAEGEKIGIIVILIIVIIVILIIVTPVGAEGFGTRYDRTNWLKVYGIETLAAMSADCNCH